MYAIWKCEIVLRKYPSRHRGQRSTPKVCRKYRIYSRLQLKFWPTKAIAPLPCVTLPRLSAFIDYSIKDNETPLVRGFQFELWALATRDDFAAECRDRMTSTYCEYIYTLVKPLTPHLSSREQRIKSALILAMLQGTPLIHSDGVNKKYQIKNIAVKVKQEVLNILHN